MSFNQIINSHFKGKPKLLEFPDPHRNRTVSVHYIDDPEIVGFTDEVDSWVASINGVHRAADIRKAMDELLNTTGRTAVAITQRVKLAAPRRRLIDA